MQKVLVAGATGYLGKFVVQEFKRQGYWVRALVRERSLHKLEEIGPFLEPAVKGQIDEVFVGEVTKPETLHRLCDGTDIVFSSIGITRQRDGVGFMDVDYQGNKNILDLAVDASVKKFIFVSVIKAPVIEDLVRPRELFVEELENSGLDHTIIRPTGFFSDMSEVLKMANSGRVYLIGEGKNRINPIHGADLAKVCVDAVGSEQHEIPVGGPVTYTHTEIGELAFSVLGKAPKITRIPAGLVNLVVKLIRPFSEHYYTLAEFFATAMQVDLVAPEAGTHTLKEFYEEFSRELLEEGSQATV
jgi:uncharacterized protein YbjT (DUF2867 family)